MAVIFPESMNRLDPNNPQASLKTIESYIQYMKERMEFAGQGMAGGTVPASVITKISELTSTLSAMQNAINTVAKAVNDINALINVTGDDLTFSKNLVVDCGVWEGRESEE